MYRILSLSHAARHSHFLCGEIPSLARVLPAATHRLSEWFGGAVLLSCLPVRLGAFRGATGKSEGPQANQDGRAAVGKGGCWDARFRAAVGTRALGRLRRRLLGLSSDKRRRNDLFRRWYRLARRVQSRGCALAKPGKCRGTAFAIGPDTKASPKPNISKPEAKHQQARSQSAPGLLYACFRLALFQLLVRLKRAAALHHAGNQDHNHGSHCGPQNRGQVEVRDALREKVRTR